MSVSIEAFPGDQAISDDVQAFVDKLPVDRSEFGERRICYWIEAMTFYGDGAGRHAVKIEIPWRGTYWNYVLIYDKVDKRKKTIKYASGHYAC